MKKLTKAQDNEHQRVAHEVQTRWDAYKDAVEALNEALSDAREIRDEVQTEMEGYYDERSERWHNSEAGEQYSEWKSSWTEIDLADVDLADHISPQDFADLPNEPGYE